MDGRTGGANRAAETEKRISMSERWSLPDHKANDKALDEGNSMSRVPSKGSKGRNTDVCTTCADNAVGRTLTRSKEDIRRRDHNLLRNYGSNAYPSHMNDCVDDY